MDTSRLVQEGVHKYYWEHDYNCTTTTLLILAEYFGIRIEPQAYDAALGMHGAGEYGAQCGLVEGGLMFLGIAGRKIGIADDAIINACRDFAEEFEDRFGSLLCRVLRPEGFRPENPPHICEDLTCRAIRFDIEFFSGIIARSEHNKSMA